jgi:hypothetical protein
MDTQRCHQRGSCRKPSAIGTDATTPTISPAQMPVVKASIPQRHQGVIAMPKQAGTPAANRAEQAIATRNVGRSTADAFIDGSVAKY